MKLGSIDYREDEKRFEKWLAERITEKKAEISLGIARQKEVVTIPVVVHVIHNGQAVGIDNNIPEEQILSQLEILNQDFRRQNPDASETLAEFLPVAADVEIEFVLARRDPEGLPSNGIVRVQGSKTDYRLTDDDLLKSESFWPTEDYLNIWVTDLANELLGYAQFPVSNLSGLSVDRDNNRLTDGVVVDYEYFGAGFNNDPFSRGRTATHEIGHFLGLRHVWGDGGCATDDFCQDTPDMGDNSSGCPGAPDTCISEGNDMFQNFMDFTDDECMNLFTICQGTRMQTILAASPRRRTLINSLGAIAPVITSNDMGIRQIISPEISECNTTIAPHIEVRNYGNNDVNGFKVDLEIDGTLIQSVESLVTLAPLEITSVIFETVELTQGNEHNYTFRITEVSNGIDGNSENDVKTKFVQVPVQTGLPLISDFENSVNDWQARKLTGEPSTWFLSNAPISSESSSNQAYKLDLFDSPENEFGNLEMLLSPVLDFEKITAAELQFKYAYAPVNGNIIDGLAVAVLSECGNTLLPGNILSDFERYGSSLGTTTMKSAAFTPTGPAEWQDATISLNQFIGQKEVQVALIAQNGGGNNIYVDELEIFANNQFKLDIKVTDVVELPLISCRLFQAPIVEVKNFGTETITSVDYQFGDGFSTNNGRLEGLSIEPGEAQNIAVGLPDLFDGEFDFNFTVTAVNDTEDDDPQDNVLIQKFRITESEDILPLREKFEQRTFSELSWFPFSITGDHNWIFTPPSIQSGNDQSISVQAFDLNETGSQNWLVSPKLDLFDQTEASMTFDVSYAFRSGFDDQLQVLVSTDCGRSFNDVVYDKRGEELAVTTSANAWIPQSPDDWVTESINLNAFAGNSEVLIAFVFTNGNGNNLYLDNFDLFISAEPSLLDLEEDVTRLFPNPATNDFNVAFNLEQKEQVRVRVVDMMGNLLLEEEMNDLLNQTVNFDAANIRSGLYLVQFIGESFKKTERVVIIR